MENIFFDDKVVGRVQIRRSKKAYRISLSLREGNVILVVPDRLTVKEGISFLQSKYDWVLAHLKKNEVTVFDENTDFRTTTFRVEIKRHSLHSFQFRLSAGVLAISCPQDKDIHAEESQTIIRQGIERALKMEAKKILPRLVEFLAKEHRFTFSNVSIRSSKSRWGSCSRQGNICLSYFLLILPDELLNYVLLHELCHTREMNHGPQFWKLMDAVTNNNAKKLRLRLKDYKTTI